ncbi:MAG: sugar phosphate isomerase/epimerase [Clostridia bacterium]|nr:sugar phosphate isomerase/epimerase [Clostridia bacterium]
MKTAVSSYSFWGYIKEGKMSMLDTVSKAAELGFDAIEFIVVTPFDRINTATKEEKIAYAKELRAKAEECGIEICAYTVGANLYWGNEVEDAAEVKRLCDEIDVAVALGAPIFRHDVTKSTKVGDKTVSFDKMLPTLVANARKVADYASIRGIKTSAENHGRVFQDSDRVERFYNAMDHENFGLLIDFGNFTCVDEDPVLAVSKLAPYAIHAHAKDFWKRKFGEEPADPNAFFPTRACNKLSGCVIGEGDVNVPQCIEILKSVNYDGYVSIEYEGSEDCIEALKRSIKNLKEFIK